MSEEENKSEEKAPESGNESPKNEFIDKVLKEKKNAMEMARQMKEQNEVLAGKLKELEDDRLMKEKNYEELAEKRLAEIEEWKNKYVKKEKMIEDSVKMNEVKKELSKLGLDARYADKATRFIDINQLQYDNDTRVVTGAQEAAAQIKEEFAPLFQSSVPGTPQGAPAGAPSPLTLDAWKQLPLEERRKRQSELYSNMGITMRK